MSDSFKILQNAGSIPVSSCGTIHRRRRVQGRCSLGSSTFPDSLQSVSGKGIKLHTVGNAHRITQNTPFGPVKELDTLTNNDIAVKNCAILACAEAHSLDPLLYTQEELNSMNAQMFFRNMGITSQGEF